MAWILGSLAPTAACALLTLSVFNSGNYNAASRPSPMLAMVLSNQSSAAYASGNGGESQNSIFSVTFDWTNHGNFTSSMAPFSRAR
jgi:hypothetical protein